MGNRHNKKFDKVDKPMIIEESNRLTVSYEVRNRIRAELIIDGFVRIHFANFHSVPKELKELCLLMFFVVIDEWNVEKSHKVNQSGSGPD